MDDTLLWSDTIEESFFQAANWLHICGRHGITLNPQKFRFAKDVVEFAGFKITNDSVRPCKKYVHQSHLRIPNPTEYNIRQILVWLSEPGLICIQYDRRDVAFPAATQTQQEVPLG